MTSPACEPPPAGRLTVGLCPLQGWRLSLRDLAQRIVADPGAPLGLRAAADELLAAWRIVALNPDARRLPILGAAERALAKALLRERSRRDWRQGWRA